MEKGYGHRRTIPSLVPRRLSDRRPKEEWILEGRIGIRVRGRGAGALPVRLVVRLHATIGGSCTPLPAAGGCAATFAVVGRPPPHGCLRCKNVEIISQLWQIVLGIFDASEGCFVLKMLYNQENQRNVHDVLLRIFIVRNLLRRMIFPQRSQSCDACRVFNIGY
jgi:hypothetical protein